MKLLSTLALGATLAACSEPLERPPPYAPVRLEAFSDEAARAACPKGYRILWREICRGNSLYDSALVLCRDE